MALEEGETVRCARRGRASGVQGDDARPQGNITVDAALHGLILPSRHSTFQIQDEDGRLTGLRS
jgi:hypothetical protein